MFGQQTVCLECKNTREREEDFYALRLGVALLSACSFPSFFIPRSVCVRASVPTDCSWRLGIGKLLATLSIIRPPSVDIRHKSNVMEGLAALFQEEVFTGSNALTCDVCGKKVTSWPLFRLTLRFG